MEINKQIVWFEIKSHYPLLLSICLLALGFFWITPPLVYQLQNPTATFHFEIGDYIIGAIILIGASIRMVIIIEN